MSEATDRMTSKLHALESYVEELRAAYSAEDCYGWREAWEKIMNVAGSEVAVWGGVVPTYKHNPTSQPKPHVRSGRRQ